MFWRLTVTPSRLLSVYISAPARAAVPVVGYRDNPNTDVVLVCPAGTVARSVGRLLRSHSNSLDRTRSSTEFLTFHLPEEPHFQNTCNEAKYRFRRHENTDTDGLVGIDRRGRS